MSSRFAPLPRLLFSYSQFMVYDVSARLEVPQWTEAHSNQGFCRRASYVCFGTLVDYGYAHLQYALGSYIHSDDYQRVIAVPFLATTGTVIIQGPEEDVSRNVKLAAGYYLLVAAQRVLGRNRPLEPAEAIDLVFQRKKSAPTSSSIIVRDKGLVVPEPLLETAHVVNV